MVERVLPMNSQHAAVLRVVWELQEEAEISGRQLARETGLGRVYLQRRLRGEVAFSIQDLDTLAAPLGVTREAIMERVQHVLNDRTHS
jgi:transcriptional regulator with XRE-family HTH domain